MAESKRPKGRPKTKSPVVLKTIGIKAAPEWAEWLERYAKHQRTTIASVIDRALEKDAAAQGFKEPPPERIP